MSKIAQVKRATDGKKTYSVAWGMVIIGVLGLLGVIDTQGTLDTAPLLGDPVNMILEGLGLGGLRKGVASVLRDMMSKLEDKASNG